ncbi:hypothetical protein BpHYR1_038237 [Brachionus plicatilis]|uniref:Uncharacterized protein n=1 Tax=Brachionus plicatilis TaxID=10195 RepID=A0A3M7Q2C4_BRAPC|nr:hypothetical protein BpHYR1_038237 [Brachionus plicatilis]
MVRIKLDPNLGYMIHLNTSKKELPLSLALSSTAVFLYIEQPSFKKPYKALKQNIACMHQSFSLATIQHDVAKI